MGHEAPLVQTRTERFPSATIAADKTSPILEAPWAGTVTECAIIPDAAATGDNTNARTFTLVNKGAAGSGTTVMGTLALTTGVDLAANVEKAFTLSVVAGATAFVEGDILALVSTHTGTGVVDGGGAVELQLTRTGAGS